MSPLQWDLSKIKFKTWFFFSGPVSLKLHHSVCPGMTFQSQYWLVSLTFHIWLLSMFYFIFLTRQFFSIVAVTILIQASFLFAWTTSLAFPVSNPSSHSPFYTSQLKYFSRETPAIIWFLCSKLMEALYYHENGYTNKASQAPRKCWHLAWANSTMPDLALKVISSASKVLPPALLFLSSPICEV